MLEESPQTPDVSSQEPVYRWWNASLGDSVGVADHESQLSAAALTAAGYTRDSAPQFYVSVADGAAADQVAVYRWWNSGDGDWVDIPDGSIADADLESGGYSDKTFQYYAHSTAATGRVALYRWWSDADRDWMTVRQGQTPDATLSALGYTNSTLVAFADCPDCAELPNDARLAAIHIDTDSGQPIASRDVWIDGQFAMSASPLLPECADVAPAPMKVRGRGNFTWTLEKKAYNLNLENKSDLCGLGSSRKWALLANHYDRSLLRTSAAMYMASLLTNMAWNPRSAPVDLYVNGTYQGSYTLIERVTIASNRIDVDELKDNQGGVNDSPPEVTGGYLLEWDVRMGNDNVVEVGGSGLVGVREPQDEADGSGITETQRAYIDQFLGEADAALFGENFTDDTEGWQKYIDAGSAVDYFLAMELTKPEDGNMFSSVMMYKERDTDPAAGDQGKLFMGPLWDMDTAMGNEDGPGALASPTEWYVRYERPDVPRQSDVTWFNRLNEDPDFQAMVSARWKEVYPDLLTTDSFLVEQQELIAVSAAENFALWDASERLGDVQVVKGSWPAEVSSLRTWLRQRIDWMNTQYGTQP